MWEPPIPADLRLALTTGFIPPRIVAQYGALRVERWRLQWQETPEGKLRTERRRAVFESDNQRREEQARFRRERQELYRVPDGSMVRINAPDGELHGRIGQVRGMEWSSDHSLIAKVMIWPVPLTAEGRAMAGSVIVKHMPIQHQIPAEHLTLVHPDPNEAV
jgi:hypothetical protein